MKAAQARILLTGGSGGIGAAAAARFVNAGASVMLVGRTPEKLSTQAHALSRDAAPGTPRVQWCTADLTQAAELEELGEIAAEWGCNVLVHCAGAPSFGPLESLDPVDMAQVLHTNLLAPMLLTRALLPHLRRLQRAQVICVGSVLGCIGLPGYSVYSATKFGLRGFAEALRRELGDSSVRVQYLGPRSTRTPFNSAGVEAYNRATGTASDTPEAVAQAMLELLESEATERFLGFPEAWAVRLNGLAPARMDAAFVKHRNCLSAAAKADAAPGATSPTTAFQGLES
ncbi:SDR family oxidoreductase [Variovorax defluvii]|uniref:SDR family oxidoreductase n=1 Tax=Variovorax defluvii TaxID=913761 RepID=A0ABP8GZG4_9BURK